MNLEDKLITPNSKDFWDSVKFVFPKSAFKNKDHVDILLYGDVHYGSSFCNEEFAKKSLDTTAERGVHIIGMGDLLETATRDSIGAGVYDSSKFAQKQLETMVEWLEPHKERIIGLCEGNHEYRVYKNTGLDLHKILCNDLDVKNLSAGSLIQIYVGKQRYDLYVCHGSSGASLPYTKIKGCLSLQQYISADVYAMGHVHALDSHSRAVHKIDKKGNVIEQEKLFVLTGHYLNYLNSYAHKKGLIPSKQGSPILKLYKDEHLVRVSL